MVYDNYTFASKEPVDIPTPLGNISLNYLIESDFLGPLFFNPPNCKTKSYPNIPKMNSSAIALVGDYTSPAM